MKRKQHKKRKNYSSSKLLKQREMYLNSIKDKNEYFEDIEEYKKETFIFNLIAKLFNEITNLKNKAFWIIIKDNGKLKLTLTNFSPRHFKEAYNLATDKYWNFYSKNKAEAYIQYLSRKKLLIKKK
jgi:hypothetical protein